MSIIKLENICKSYGTRKIISNASFCVEQGELVGIIGRSGLGKTTLLNIIGLLDAPDSGNYYFEDKRIDFKDEQSKTALLRDCIGFIVQDYALIRDRTIYQNVALPLLSKTRNRELIKSKVSTIMDKLEISELSKKYAYEVSGGEAQRVAIARALVRTPKVILADEPTGALDESSEENVLQLLKSLRQTGVSIVIVTHNPVVAKICTRTYTISDEKIIEYYKDA